MALSLSPNGSSDIKVEWLLHPSTAQPISFDADIIDRPRPQARHSLLAASMSTMLFVHVPHQHLGQFGPFSCSKGIDELGVAQYARTLLDSTAQLHDRRQKLANYDIWIELPKIPDQYKDRHVLLLFKRGPTVHVYVVGMERDTISERKIRNFLGSIYGVRCDSLSMCEGEQQDQNPSEIGIYNTRGVCMIVPGTCTTVTNIEIACVPLNRTISIILLAYLLPFYIITNS